MVVFPPERVRAEVVKSRPNKSPADFAGFSFPASGKLAARPSRKLSHVNLPAINHPLAFLLGAVGFVSSQAGSSLDSYQEEQPSNGRL